MEKSHRDVFAGQFECAILMAVKATAKQLGMNLTKRKALQTIPVAGALIGASMNVLFLGDVAWAARRVFQSMKLADEKSTL